MTTARLEHLPVEELAETLAMFDDWTDKYRFIIDLGRRLPPMPDAEKTEATRVKGCQSNVWVTAQPVTTAQPVLEFHADSDSEIVKGLAALILGFHVGQPAHELLAFDHEAAFAQLSLDQHLSMNRRNGLRGLLQKVRHYADQVPSAIVTTG